MGIMVDGIKTALIEKPDQGAGARAECPCGWVARRGDAYEWPALRFHVALCQQAKVSQPPVRVSEHGTIIDGET